MYFSQSLREGHFLSFTPAIFNDFPARVLKVRAPGRAGTGGRAPGIYMNSANSSGSTFASFRTLFNVPGLSSSHESKTVAQDFDNDFSRDASKSRQLLLPQRWL